MSDTTLYADDALAVDKLLAYAILDYTTPTGTKPPPVEIDPNLDPFLTRAALRGSARLGPGVRLRLVPEDER
jgi:hypothetical protein